MANLPNPGNPVEVTRAALDGVKQAIQVGREIKDTAREMNTFLDEEARARVAWRRRQQEAERRGDMIVVDAVQEYQIIRQMQDQRDDLYRAIRRKFGAKGVDEVKALEARLKKDRKELDGAFNKDRMHSRKEWGGIMLIAAIIYGVLKFTGVW